MSGHQNAPGVSRDRTIIEGLKSRRRERRETAARLLFRSYYERLVDQLSRAAELDCIADAEEIAADVLIRLIQKPELYDCTRGALGAFLIVVARNAGRDLRRRRGREENLAESGTLLTATHSEPSERRVELVDQLRQAIRELPSGLRQATTLHLEGKSNAEIASELGLEIGAVRTRVSRSRSWLRRRLG